MSYKAIVCALRNLRPHPNADRLQIAELFGETIIVGKDSKAGDLGIMFPTDGCLDYEFCRVNGLLRKNPDGSKGSGFFEDDCRVKAVKLRGVLSTGFWCPLSYLDNLRPGLSSCVGFEGQLIDVIDSDLHLCRKYITPATRSARPAKVGTSQRNIPTFPMHMETEQLAYAGDSLQLGAQLVVTSKMHGTCLPSKARILKWDGSVTHLKNISVGDVVVGLSNGRLVPSTVMDKFANGPTDVWSVVKVGRYGLGAGQTTLTATHDHLVMTDEGWVEAKDLQDKRLLSVRHTYQMTDAQLGIALGILLGDGHLPVSHKGSIQFRHKVDHLEYVEYCLAQLGSDRKIQYRTSGYGSPMAVGSTGSSEQVWKLFSPMMASGHKSVPIELVELATPTTLAFLYMDDGSLAGIHPPNKRPYPIFAICGFQQADAPGLKAIFQKFGFRLRVKLDSSGFLRGSLSVEEAPRFFELIALYVPACMQYKLPEQYRGRFSNELVPQGSIAPYATISTPAIVTTRTAKEVGYSTKWDLTTTTGNFVAHGVLVHNSGRVAYVWAPLPLTKWQERINAFTKRFFHHPLYPEFGYSLLHGSRRVVLSRRDDFGCDFHSHDLREQVVRAFEGKLRMGELVYFEIVGYEPNGKPIMPPANTTKLADKTFSEKYGERMDWSYGCLPGQHKIFVYRIAYSMPDGTVIDLPWDDVHRRTEQMGMETVKFITAGTASSIMARYRMAKGVDKEDCFLEAIDRLADREDPVGNHWQEGVCVRVDGAFPKIYKYKNKIFKYLESISKDDPTAVDTEEAA